MLDSSLLLLEQFCFPCLCKILGIIFMDKITNKGNLLQANLFGGEALFTKAHIRSCKLNQFFSSKLVICKHKQGASENVTKIAWRNPRVFAIFPLLDVSTLVSIRKERSCDQSEGIAYRYVLSHSLCLGCVWWTSKWDVHKQEVVSVIIKY